MIEPTIKITKRREDHKEVAAEFLSRLKTQAHKRESSKEMRKLNEMNRNASRVL
jgi:hypothetical protein